METYNQNDNLPLRVLKLTKDVTSLKSKHSIAFVNKTSFSDAMSFAENNNAIISCVGMLNNKWFPIFYELNNHTFYFRAVTDWVTITSSNFSTYLSLIRFYMYVA